MPDIKIIRVSTGLRGEPGPAGDAGPTGPVGVGILGDNGVPTDDVGDDGNF